MLENVTNIYKKIYNLQQASRNMADFKPEMVKEFEKMYQEMTQQKNTAVTGSAQNAKTEKAVHPFLEKTDNNVSTATRLYHLESNDPETNKRINEAITNAAEKHQVAEDLIKAIIKVESNYDPYAVSKAGAMGLMQLMPNTMLALGVEKPFDIEENIDGGTNYIKQMLTKYDGDLDKSLAAYNAGPFAVDEANGIPDIFETINYVSAIKKLLLK